MSSRWRGCESLQEMKVRFASTLLPSFSLPRRHRIPHSRPFHNLDYIQNIRKQNTKLYWLSYQFYNQCSVKYVNCTTRLDGAHTHTHKHWVVSNQVGTESLGGEAALISHHQHKVGQQSGQGMSIEYWVLRLCICVWYLLVFLITSTEQNNKYRVWVLSVLLGSLISPAQPPAQNGQARLREILILICVTLS